MATAGCKNSGSRVKTKVLAKLRANRITAIRERVLAFEKQSRSARV